VTSATTDVPRNAETVTPSSVVPDKLSVTVPETSPEGSVAALPEPSPEGSVAAATVPAAKNVASPSVRAARSIHDLSVTLCSHIDMCCLSERRNERRARRPRTRGLDDAGDVRAPRPETGHAAKVSSG
jgi:hypothetical protein